MEATGRRSNSLTIEGFIRLEDLSRVGWRLKEPGLMSKSLIFAEIFRKNANLFNFLKFHFIFLNFLLTCSSEYRRSRLSFCVGSFLL